VKCEFTGKSTATLASATNPLLEFIAGCTFSRAALQGDVSRPSKAPPPKRHCRHSSSRGQFFTRRPTFRALGRSVVVKAARKSRPITTPAAQVTGVPASSLLLDPPTGAVAAQAKREQRTSTLCRVMPSCTNKAVAKLFETFDSAPSLYLYERSGTHETSRMNRNLPVLSPKIIRSCANILSSSQ
jgi:hypothetical protein